MFRKSSMATEPSPRSGDILRAIGEQLRAQRQSLGESLDSIGEALRIRPHYLACLEDGDYSDLPGHAYAFGFLKAYGSYLGFDGEALSREARAGVDGTFGKPELVVKQPLRENSVPKGPLLFMSVLLAGVVYIGWHYIYNRDRPVIESITQVPDFMRESIDDLVGEQQTTTPDEAAAAGTTPQVAASDPSALSDASERLLREVEASLEQAGRLTGEPPAVSTRAPQGDRAGATQAPSAAVASERTAPPSLDADGDAPSESAESLLAALEAELDGDAPSDAAETDAASGNAVADGSRLVLRARESAWIQVQSPDRDYVRTRTLQVGDEFVVPADRTDLELWTGNAGGLMVVVDGREVALLGESGGVVRDVPLDPERLLTRLNVQQ